MPDECPLAVQLLYDRCIATDPEARPSAREVYDELVAAIKGTPAPSSDAEAVKPARSAPVSVSDRKDELGMANGEESPFSTALSHPPTSREPTGQSAHQSAASPAPASTDDALSSLVPSLLGVQVVVGRPRMSSTPLPASSTTSLGPRMSDGPDAEYTEPIKARSLRLGGGEPWIVGADLQEPDWLKLARRVSRSSNSRRLLVVVDDGGPRDTPSMTPPSPFMTA